MLIKWRDINSVNVKQLDEHHKVIVRIINKLNKKLGKKELDKLVQELKDYSKFHFDAEEGYFKEFKYPLTKSHVEEHRDYIKKIRQFERKEARGTLQLEEMTDFLSAWWIGHINYSDTKYSDFLNQRGVY